MMYVNKSHIGETVGIYNIVEQMSYKDTAGQSLYKGICNECGFERIARYRDLKISSKCTHIGINGKVKLCVNWSNKRIKRIFDDMKQRCYNKNRKDYRWYGAKGIKICDEWFDNPKSFEEWALQNGYQDNLTIDRINENKNYSPDNCRWIENKQNAKYKSTTFFINVDGEIHSGKDWSKILGLGANRISTYVRKYGLENTIEFIKRYKSNPEFKSNNKNIYNVYMN